jgi:hypothetical protein
VGFELPRLSMYLQYIAMPSVAAFAVVVESNTAVVLYKMAVPSTLGEQPAGGKDTAAVDRTAARLNMDVGRSVTQVEHLIRAIRSGSKRSRW